MGMKNDSTKKKMIKDKKKLVFQVGLILLILASILIVYDHLYVHQKSKVSLYIADYPAYKEKYENLLSESEQTEFECYEEIEKLMQSDLNEFASENKVTTENYEEAFKEFVENKYN